MKKKVCLLLGGSGFLGKNLCRSLLADGRYDIRVYNHASGHLADFRQRFPNITIYEREFHTEETFPVLLEDVDIAFHLISTTNPSNRDMLTEFEYNVIPTLKFLRACASKRIPVMYFSSGGAVYGYPRYLPLDESHAADPISPYGIHKASIEKCIAYYGRAYGLDYKILRISNPYGGYQRAESNQGAIAVFLAKLLRHEQIEIWGDGNAVRDYIYVEDVISACRRLMVYKGPYHVFNIGSGKGYSLNEVLCIMQRLLHDVAVVHYSKNRVQDVPVNIVETGLLQKAISWTPSVDLEEGIRRMIAMWDPSSGTYLPDRLD